MPIWQRVTDVLGIERRSNDRAGAADQQSEGAAAAAATGVTAPAARMAQPASPSTGAPGPAVGAQTAGSLTPAPTSTAPTSTAPTSTAPTSTAPTSTDPNRGAPTHPGPQQYRVGDGYRPGVAPEQRPGPAPAASTTGAVAPPASTALLATTTPVGGPKPAESAPGGSQPVTPVRRTRKARLRLSRLDPWSVMKTAFLFSIAAGIMLVVAVYAVWTVLSTSGLFASVNDIVASVVSTPGDTTPFRVEDYINTQRVVGIAALLGAVDVLLITALATLGSFLYNLAATMLGGLEVTLAED